jgi:hypothetical protein
MTQQKDFKRLVRARMQKTGESYTAARANILKKTTARNGSAAAPPAGARFRLPAVDYERLSGVRNAVLEERTGCTWERWVPLLDRLGAAQMSHTELARMVHTKFKIDGWWAQSVTVGYERIKGLRAIGQRRDGSYEAGKSRTFNVPLARLFDAWADAGMRKRWLDTAGVRVRKATPTKSLRLGWPDDGIVAVGFESKGPSKSVVSLAHTKLPDRATSDRLKKYWTERLDALADVLSR